MAKMKRTMDGNEAAAYASYAFTEVAAIYPITPSSPMAECVDEWAAKGKKNIFGQKVKLVEMESEAGAAGAVNGSLEGGALTTSYTASQGLLLMIPTMYRISGMLEPAVIHVASRSVATHAFSIFGEHSDVMACRQTGFAILASSNVQQAMDLGAVAHLSAIKGRVPFMHFFDGFRTSHEIQKIDCLDYDDLRKLIDKNALRAFRKRAINPEHPNSKSTGQNPDLFFQNREACNVYYDAVPDIVEEYMNKINKLTGKNYKLFNYYGADDAEYVVMAMGSVNGAMLETVDYLNAKGEKVGIIEVHLYRPFSVKHLIKEVPATVKKIAVLDKTKEPGSVGEPLYEDVCAAFNDVENKPEIFAGRFGLGGRDTTPAHIVAIYNNLKQGKPKNHFTVGINDDVTHHSIETGKEIDIVPEGTISCKFWGLGSDGTVGANKNSIKIIGDHTDKYVQAYFEYDGKKSGGITISHLRFGDKSIHSTYFVKKANFVACHNQSYINKYDMIADLKTGGTFLLNCEWKAEELEQHLPNKFKKYAAENNINLYIIDATAIAKEIGLGNRTNTVLQAAFFKLANVIPIDDAVKYMKEAILKTYGRKGDKVINMNYSAVDNGVERFVKVDVPVNWAQLKVREKVEDEKLPTFVRKLLNPVNTHSADDTPVSTFKNMEDGTVPAGTSKYEKRGIAVDVPTWDKDKCIQCNQCAYVCPHAAIRPFLINKNEASNAPERFEVVYAKGKGLEDYKFRVQVDVLDCSGCGSCVNVCPAKEKALAMKPLSSQLDEMKNWEYAVELKRVPNPMNPTTTVKGSQFELPLLEFSGACAGCGETPYAKLVTQLYGDRMYIANATGCSQAWATSYPSFPYTANEKGQGPAYTNSLFENNAEFGLGILLAVDQQRDRIKQKVEKLIEITSDDILKKTAAEWMDSFKDGKTTKTASAAFVEALSSAEAQGEEKEIVDFVLNNKEHLVKKSIWLFGGDGWAYDIGYGGLDHVISTNPDINILVFDTEVYSNTGGQSSKATPMGAVAQFAASGKRFKKKDLGMMAITYGDVYVAQVAMGANQTQLLKAITEAESYPGTSIIIAYAPCINHGLKAGMGKVQTEIKNAVDAGYWHLYRYNPLLKKEGKNPFILDSKEPTENFKEFLRGEVRYSSLERSFPKEAEELFKIAEKDAEEKYEKYKNMATKGL